MAYPSHIARGALRSALRNHRDADLILQGRLVNTLPLAELKAALAAIGEDPDAIAAAALAGTTLDQNGIANAHTRGMDAFDAGCKAHNNPYGGIGDTRHHSLRNAWHEGWTFAEKLHRGMDQAQNQEEDLRSPDETAWDRDHPADAIAEAIANPAITDAIEAEVQTIRGLIVTGGFSALDDRLRELVTEARKPPVEVRVEVEVPGPAVDLVPSGSQPVHVSKLTGKMGTWRALFGVKGALASRETALWDGSHPNTPRVNDRYLWPHPQTETALTQVSRGRNVMLYGPAGTGKTEFAQQLAARTGRPFALISCDNGTDAATLVGMTVPDASGGVTWQDGQLTRAIKTPGCVICLDEPSVARPGALFVLQNVLANRELFIAETGQRVCVAPGVLFIATDNTNGTGGGARKGYTDTNRLNAAFLDRFGVRVRVDYLPAAQEADVIVGYTGCTVELAKLLVSAATLTRAAADNQTLSHGIGLRRLLSWAELLIDGIDPEEAFQAAVLNCASEQDIETLREQCLLSYDKRAVAAALKPTAPMSADPTVTNPTPAGREAASDFDSTGTNTGRFANVGGAS